MTGMSPDIFQVKTGTRPQCFFNKFDKILLIFDKSNI